MNKGNSIRNGSEKDAYTPQKHDMNVQSEQVIKIESVSRSQREEGYGTVELTKTCDYMEMRVFTSKLFQVKVLYDSHFGATNYYQILKFLKNICAHLFSNFELKILYRHHHSKTRCNTFAIALCTMVWGGGVALLNIVYL